ncbi:MAG: N-acetylneuraminate synthase, partial [Pyrinomonas methylaliphatogenes]|nr:N-acetylneuraminate synthase [Pyrinomonas methylaliphatogenes]
AGTVLRAEHLTGKKPGVGIPVGRLNEVIGRRTRREIRAGELLFEADIEA